MDITSIDQPGFENIVKAEIVPGITSIIAVHNTKLGPGLGGVRFYPYSHIEDGLTDVLRLSEAMSYKAAMAGLPLGGGKAVIVGDPAKDKTDELLMAFGKFVDSLKGQYLTAKDVGITVEDLGVIAQATPHVTGTNQQGSSGDPSPMTAYGVYQGMRAAAQFVWQENSLKDKKVIIQGLGKVGWAVAEYLQKEGAVVMATDVSGEIMARAVSELKVEKIAMDAWYQTSADIICPCAMGASLNAQTIAGLNQNGVKIIAGGANNQLADVASDGQKVFDAGMVYAPDYVINAGGIINITCELEDTYSEDRAFKMTAKIYDTLLEIFKNSKQQNQPTSVISDQMARKLLA